MNELDTTHEELPRCPKRLWVMLTLSDDELASGSEPLPMGLRFHLSRCESCRRLSQQLQNVSSRLAALSNAEPAEQLVREADSRARKALAQGAWPAERGGAGSASSVAPSGLDSRLRAWTRYAVAAMIGGGAVLLGVWATERPSPDAAGTVAARTGETLTAPPRLIGDDRNPAKDAGPADALAAGRATVPVDAPLEGPPARPARLASGHADDPQPAKKRPLRICEFDPYNSSPGPEEAACVYRAMQLPRRGARPEGRR